MIKGFAKERTVLINRELLQGSLGSCEVGATLFSVLQPRKLNFAIEIPIFFLPLLFSQWTGNFFSFVI